MMNILRNPKTSAIILALTFLALLSFFVFGACAASDAIYPEGKNASAQDEIAETIYSAIVAEVTGKTPGRVVFIGSDGTLDDDARMVWDDILKGFVLSTGTDDSEIILDDGSGNQDYATPLKISSGTTQHALTMSLFNNSGLTYQEMNFIRGGGSIASPAAAGSTAVYGTINWRALTSGLGAESKARITAGRAFGFEYLTITVDDTMVAQIANGTMTLAGLDFNVQGEADIDENLNVDGNAVVVGQTTTGGTNDTVALSALAVPATQTVDVAQIGSKTSNASTQFSADGFITINFDEQSAGGLLVRSGGNLSYLMSLSAAGSGQANFGTMGLDHTTPSTLTQDWDDYTGWAGSSHVRVATDNDLRTITGIEATYPGHVRIIRNVGSFNLILAHESLSSTAANRIVSPTGADYTLTPGRMIMSVYDGESDRTELLLNP